MEGAAAAEAETRERAHPGGPPQASGTGAGAVGGGGGQVPLGVVPGKRDRKPALRFGNAATLLPMRAALAPGRPRATAAAGSRLRQSKAGCAARGAGC